MDDRERNEYTADEDRDPRHGRGYDGHPRPPGREPEASARTYDSQPPTRGNEPYLAGYAYGLGGQARGRFRGVGPRNYRRPDERILEEACERLTIDDQVDASDISVQVDQGEVVLEGTVDTRQAKRRAEDLADVSGVQDVRNHLRVRRD